MPINLKSCFTAKLLLPHTHLCVSAAALNPRFNQKPLRPSLPLLHLVLTSSTHPSGRFQLVNSQSCQTTTPHLSSGCEHPRGRHEAEMRPVCKAPKAVRSEKPAVFCLQGEQWGIMCFFSPFRCKHTNTSHGLRWVWTAFFFLLSKWRPNEARSSSVWRSGVLEERCKELKSQRYWQRKAARHFVTLFSAESISALLMGSYMKGGEMENNSWKGGKQKEKEWVRWQVSPAAGKKNISFLRQLFAEAKSLVIKTAHRDSCGIDEKRAFVLLLSMELRGFWYSSFALIKHLMCYCVYTFTDAAEKTKKKLQHCFLHLFLSAAIGRAAVQRWQWKHR